MEMINENVIEVSWKVVLAERGNFVAITSACILVCLIVSLLGVKLRWFKRRLDVEQRSTTNEEADDSITVDVEAPQIWTLQTRNRCEEIFESVHGIDGIFRRRTEDELDDIGLHEQWPNPNDPGRSQSTRSLQLLPPIAETPHDSPVQSTLPHIPRRRKSKNVDIPPPTRDAPRPPVIKVLNATTTRMGMPAFDDFVQRLEPIDLLATKNITQRTVVDQPLKAPPKPPLNRYKMYACLRKLEQSIEECVEPEPDATVELGNEPAKKANRKEKSACVPENAGYIKYEEVDTEELPDHREQIGTTSFITDDAYFLDDQELKKVDSKEQCSSESSVDIFGETPPTASGWQTARRLSLAEPAHSGDFTYLLRRQGDRNTEGLGESPLSQLASLSLEYSKPINIKRTRSEAAWGFDKKGSSAEPVHPTNVTYLLRRQRDRYTEGFGESPLSQLASLSLENSKPTNMKGTRGEAAWNFDKKGSTGAHKQEYKRFWQDMQLGGKDAASFQHEQRQTTSYNFKWQNKGAASYAGIYPPGFGLRIDEDWANFKKLEGASKCLKTKRNEDEADSRVKKKSIGVRFNLPADDTKTPTDEPSTFRRRPTGYVREMKKLYSHWGKTSGGHVSKVELNTESDGFQQQYGTAGPKERCATPTPCSRIADAKRNSLKPGKAERIRHNWSFGIKTKTDAEQCNLETAAVATDKTKRPASAGEKPPADTDEKLTLALAMLAESWPRRSKNKADKPTISQHKPQPAPRFRNAATMTVLEAKEKNRTN